MILLKSLALSQTLLPLLFRLLLFIPAALPWEWKKFIRLQCILAVRLHHQCRQKTHPAPVITPPLLIIILTGFRNEADLLNGQQAELRETEA